DLPTLHLRADLSDLSSSVSSRDPWHRYRQAGHAFAHEDVEVVQPDGLAAHEHIAWPYDRIRKVPIYDVFNAALLLDDRSCHVSILARSSPEPPESSLMKRFTERCQCRDAFSAAISDIFRQACQSLGWSKTAIAKTNIQQAVALAVERCSSNFHVGMGTSPSCRQRRC